MTDRPVALTVKGLLKVFFGLVLGTGVITFVTFWISPILGTITAFVAAVAWTFKIAPRLAGQMVAAIILARRARKTRA